MLPFIATFLPLHTGFLMNLNDVLLDNGYIDLKNKKVKKIDLSNYVELSTIISNFIYYGYTPSLEIIKVLSTFKVSDLVSFWSNIEPSLSKKTNSDKNMSEFVLYQNFPSEVLEKSKAEYWFNQIFIYLGFDKEFFREEVKDREPLKLEDKNLKVLHILNKDVKYFYNSLISSGSRWSDEQFNEAVFWVNEYKREINFDRFNFKENAIKLCVEFFDKQDIKISINSTQDVFRLASGLSGFDISLRNNVNFKSFKRSERRKLLSILDKSSDLYNVVANRQELSKRLFSRLHPNDYKFKNVNLAYDYLYKGELNSYHSVLQLHINEAKKEMPSPSIFYYRMKDLLLEKKSIFMRRFHELYTIFGSLICYELIDVLDTYKTSELLKFLKYLETINDREKMIYTPRGNWSRAQENINKKMKLKCSGYRDLVCNIKEELGRRLDYTFGNISIDERLTNLKIKKNDNKLANYGSGTTFFFDESINYIRSGVYWDCCDDRKTTYFDNSISLLDEDYNPITHTNYANEKAMIENECLSVFSGDETNTTNDGKASQFIDTNIKNCINNGVRYLLFSVLSYNRINFDSANDVIATLQLMNDSLEGEIYDPNRSKFNFNIKDNTKNKFVCIIDLKEKSIKYLDNSYSNINVGSIQQNSNNIKSYLEHYNEYLNSSPSLYDLLSCSNKLLPIENESDDTVKFCYSDKSITVKGRGFVFLKENDSNSFDSMSVEDIFSTCDSKINR
jgi:hypothetical protein